jgi:hypothetical protein
MLREMISRDDVVAGRGLARFVMGPFISPRLASKVTSISCKRIGAVLSDEQSMLPGLVTD